MIFEVLVVLKMSAVAFWFMIPCGLVAVVTKGKGDVCNGPGPRVFMGFECLKPV
jgi:hypothetical protein